MQRKLFLVLASGGLVALCAHAAQPVAAIPSARTSEAWWAERHTAKLLQISKARGDVDVVLLGDSITHNWEYVWGKEPLASFRRAYSILNVGYAGDRTEHLLWRCLHGELDGYKAKCVVLLIGTNNEEGVHAGEWSDVVTGIREILSVIADRQPQATTLLLPIFPRGADGTDPRRIRNRRVNGEIRKLADGKKVVWLDFTDKFLDANGDTKALMPDRLHPNADGYRVWMDALMPVLKGRCPRRPAFNVLQRGIIADGKTCQADAISQLVAEAPEGAKVVFPAGEYYLSKPVVVSGKRNIAFLGEEGTRFVLYFTPWGGQYDSAQAFNAAKCEGLSFRRMTFTTDNPVNCAGRIVAINREQGTYDVRIADEFPITGREHFMGTDTCDEDGMPDYAIETSTKDSYEVIGPQLVRVVPPGGKAFDFSRIRVGHRVLYRYIIYGRTVFSFDACTDMVLKDIRIERCASMGVIVMPPSRNLTMERFVMRSPEGSEALFCSNADGVHILGMSGSLVLRDCHFAGLGDDALNIHGKAAELKSLDRQSGKAKFICRNIRRQECRLPKRWAAAGDELIAYDCKTFKTKGHVKVVGYSDDGDAELDIGDAVIGPGDIFANKNVFATVDIANCSVRNTRARGFLLQSQNMTIRDCSFEGLALPGILISPDINIWNEVGPTVNTEIRNCSFRKCGMHRSPANLGTIAVKTSHDIYPNDRDVPGVHRDVRIIGNRFTGCGNSGIFLNSTEGVLITGNTFSKCSIRRFSENEPRNLYDIWLHKCASVILKGNRTDKGAGKLLCRE